MDVLDKELRAEANEEGRQDHQEASVGHPGCHCSEGQQWGPAESINSCIKAIRIRSHGFHNKERTANATYFHLGGLDLHPEGASSG